ncbi:MAG TPA: phosphatidate cytidylyltransferase [Candidatus Cloacimonadota bacterium]|jgi:dolichol kinase|nr:phosphatidate cytidylyltransferase [Candidatus Cloacimonadales bacterium]HPY95828.1 phosphatidate cytidylyltransferase [Candidatus Cloacimonadota bacterium]HQB40530.1 phosphatidate cytidylyltransferase [Candidatus Cloacimonadota bacterium]
MTKETKELMRKSIHFSSILIPMLYRYVLDFERKTALLILLFLAIVSIIIEYLRLENKSFQRVFYTVFGVMLRRHEIYNFSGASFLLTSSIFCIAFYPPDIAFLSLCFLSIGDTFAALIGITFGKRKFTFVSKSLEGSIACFLSTFVFSLFYINPIIAFTGALGATIAEFINIPVDDNVRIPVISGLIMILTYILLPENIESSSNIYRILFK